MLLKKINPTKVLFTCMFVFGLASANVAQAAENFKFKFQSSDNSGSENFIAQQQWAKNLATLSNNVLLIEMLPTGTIVKHTETLDAISAGVLDGHITALGYFSGKDPAFGLLGNTVGAWSDPNELLMFMEFGGGNQLVSQLLAPYGVTSLGASTTGLEAFVSKIPLNGVADLKGLKLRAPEGLVQAVFAAAGASPVNLPGSEVFTSLDKGVIQAADYTVFSTNDQQGLHKIAPHPIYPGFHSLPLINIAMNTKKFNQLPNYLQKLLKNSVISFSRDITGRLKVKDLLSVAKARKNPNITIHNWSDKERKKFRTIAQAQWKKYAQKSPNAKKAYKILTSYFVNHGLL